MSEDYDMFQFKRCAIFAKRTDLLSGPVILNLKLRKDQAKRNVKCEIVLYSCETRNDEKKGENKTELLCRIFCNRF